VHPETSPNVWKLDDFDWTDAEQLVVTEKELGRGFANKCMGLEETKFVYAFTKENIV
jgi:hypothetical protein